MELATHTPFVPQGVPPVSSPFDLITPKAVRPPRPVEPGQASPGQGRAGGILGFALQVANRYSR